MLLLRYDLPMAMEDRDYFQHDRERRRQLGSPLPASNPPSSKPRPPLGPIRIPAYDQAMAGKRSRSWWPWLLRAALVLLGALVLLWWRR